MPRPQLKHSDNEEHADLNDAEVRERLRRDVALVRGHPSTAEGDRFVDATLADSADWQE